MTSMLRALGLVLLLLAGGASPALHAEDGRASIPLLAAVGDAEVAAEPSAAADPVVAAAQAPAKDGPHDHEPLDEHADGPAVWSVIPFALLLLAIAICPLVAGHFWHHHYPKVSVALGLITGSYYLFGLHNPGALIHVGFEYLSFIALLASLFVAAGGIVINIDKKATPWVNLVILLIGSVVANVIGTTGAAMLLIRPFMRVNKGRLKPYHVVFFIFMVANVGGALTPIGDPPLFLGYLRGIDFFDFLSLNFKEWVFALLMLSGIFLMLDLRNRETGPELSDGGGISIRGYKNFIFLALIIGAVFLDPNKIGWLPAVAEADHRFFFVFGHGIGAEAVTADGDKITYFSFIREIIQFSVALAAYKLADHRNLQANGFNFEPIKEVGFLFIGIFLTMVPALELIKAQAVSGELFGLPLNATTFYFGTGILSGVLDNAPTFVSFLAGLEGVTNLSPAEMSAAMAAGEIPAKATAGLTVDALAIQLAACAVASVFWGAMTYIGNGPNFMVKAIAESSRDEHGEPVVHCPSFFGYVIKYSVPYLLPVLILNWLIFISPWSLF